MARGRGSVWGARVVEWGILAGVLGGFVWFFAQHAQRIHAQAERAQVVTTLGALRTAMVLGQLEVEVKGRNQPPPQSPSTNPNNPFDALGYYPPNYGGAVSGRDLAAVAPGQWVYDAGCGCIGYKPLYPDSLESKDQLDALWFQRRTLGAVGVLVALDRYVWQGQSIE